MQAKLMAAETMTALEDLYLPYRPKRRTRATIAKERGLEPHAVRLRATLMRNTGSPWRLPRPHHRALRHRRTKMKC
ncbi:MAG: hypothetical protein HC870_00435 [Rhizobiales bacterium]|nr:hypothetical protein [Hyphomicrobiales bacterium]